MPGDETALAFVQLTRHGPDSHLEEVVAEMVPLRELPAVALLLSRLAADALARPVHVMDGARATIGVG